MMLARTSTRMCRGSVSRPAQVAARPAARSLVQLRAVADKAEKADKKKSKKGERVGRAGVGPAAIRGGRRARAARARLGGGRPPLVALGLAAGGSGHPLPQMRSRMRRRSPSSTARRWCRPPPRSEQPRAAARAPPPLGFADRQPAGPHGPTCPPGMQGTSPCVAHPHSSLQQQVQAFLTTLCGDTDIAQVELKVRAPLQRRLGARPPPTPGAQQNAHKCIDAAASHARSSVRHSPARAHK